MSTLSITCPSCQHGWDIEAPAIPWRALPAYTRVKCPSCHATVRVMVQAKDGQVHISFRNEGVKKEENDIMAEAIFRSDHLHTLMELVDQQIHAIPVSPEAEGYINFLKDLKDRVMAAWAQVNPGQEGVLVVREEGV